MQHTWQDETETVLNPSHNRPFAAVLQGYLSRRQVLQGSLTSLVLASFDSGRVFHAVAATGFTPLQHTTEDVVRLPAGYQSSVVVRWGDPVVAEAADFAHNAQTPAAQAGQFGYNADFVAFMPLPQGSQNATRGLLVVNHEYTNPGLMFPQWDRKNDSKTRDMVDIELAAHGLSVVEVERDASGAWSYVRNSSYNRRITAETPMTLSGPAAGHAWLITSYDATGTKVRGTLNNCAGGVTPWGTMLTCEENFNGYFGGALEDAAQAVRAVHQRYGVRDRYGWVRYHERFNVSTDPHEPLRFGWVVEIDPYDPQSTPVKRTALGRFKHEAATVVIATSGQVVVYSGDDGRFEYIYKFVSTGRYTPENREAHHTLLDSGTLYVARFQDDGSGIWLPLVFGQGPLIASNGFPSQAEVLINARRAADFVGATKMDNPEDVEAHPKTGVVYAVMSSNTSRRADQVDKANPRPENKHGHIIEIHEAGGDHSATTFRWEIFLLGGDPKNPDHRAFYQTHKDVSWLSCPDNIAFDDAGRLWIATDGQPESIQANDAVYVTEVAGPQRGLTRMFLSGPARCEIAGPAFTPDCTTLFVAIQHPGAGKGATFAQPRSRFPDYRPDMPPRPSVIAVYRQDGGKIGT